MTPVTGSFELKTFESATIESQIESSFFEISNESFQNQDPTSVENQSGNEIYPQEFVSCVKIYDDDKGRTELRIKLGLENPFQSSTLGIGTSQFIQSLQFMFNRFITNFDGHLI